jgi:hypothetical protein
MSTNTNFVRSGQSACDFVTPRQLVSIKTISASLDIDAKSECQRLCNCDLKTLTVAAAARLIADLRSRLIRQEARNNDLAESSFENQ